MKKCTAGNKPCGKRCIPVKWKCKDGKPQRPRRKEPQFKQELLRLAVGIAGIAVTTILFEKIKNGSLKRSKNDDFDPKVESGFKLNDPKVLKDIKSLRQEEASPWIEKDFEKATTMTVTIEEFSKYYKVNPEIMKKIPKDLPISLSDTTRPEFEKLKLSKMKAGYFPEYDKLIVNPAAEDLSENLNKELISWYQFNKGKFFMTDDEYIKAKETLKPVQKLFFQNVEDAHRKIWTNQALRLVKKGRAHSILKTYIALSRAEFEAYYLAVDWNALEKKVKEKGLI